MCSPRHALLSELDDGPFVEAVQKRYGAIPKVLLDNPAVLEVFLPTLRADFRLLDRYAYVDEPPLDVPIVALHGSQDHVEVAEDVQAWETHTSAEASFQCVDGGHFFARESPELLADVLDQAMTKYLPSI